MRVISIVLVVLVLVNADDHREQQVLRVHRGQDWSCPRGFFLVGSKCYFHGNFRLNWYSALEYCHKLDNDASLASFETREETQELRRILALRGDPGTGVWIGGSDHGHHGTWTWMPTGESVTYFNWAEGQPDSLDNDQHCLYLVGGELDYVWADFHCDFAMHFLCEADIHEEFDAKPTQTTTTTTTKTTTLTVNPSTKSLENIAEDIMVDKSSDKGFFSTSSFLERLLRRKLSMAAGENAVQINEGPQKSKKKSNTAKNNYKEDKNNFDDNDKIDIKDYYDYHSQARRAFERLMARLISMRRAK